MFLTFWLGNVLRATTLRTFSTSQLPRWLRTRRFSEPTFRPSAATNHWKNIMYHDVSTFSRTCISFLRTFSLLWSSLFCSSRLWLFPPLLFHLSILSEVWLLNFLRQHKYIYIYIHGLVIGVPTPRPPPQWYGSPGCTPFPSICKLLAAFLRSTLAFARSLLHFWLPASHLLGACY